MSRRRHVVRLGIPALLVAGLALAALWRVGPANEAEVVGTTGMAPRPASLERVRVLRVLSPRAMWVGDDDHPTFVVLDPDVKRDSAVALAAGRRVTLTGLVRPAPPEPQAMQQWGIDQADAHELSERGTYLHCTEIS